MQFKTVLNWVDAVQFGMAEAVLEQEGIPFFVDGYRVNSSLYDPLSEFTHDKPSLRVRAQDFERAQMLLIQTVGRGIVD